MTLKIRTPVSTEAVDAEHVEKARPVATGRLVFDGRCGFCTRSIGWLRRVDRHDRVETVPLQAPGAPESVGATEAECLTAIRWQGEDGRRLYGAAAANAALSAALGRRIPTFIYRVTGPLQERAYRWIAANRFRFAGVQPHCEQFPAECRS